MTAETIAHIGTLIGVVIATVINRVLSSKKTDKATDKIVKNDDANTKVTHANVKHELGRLNPILDRIEEIGREFKATEISLKEMQTALSFEVQDFRKAKEDAAKSLEQSAATGKLVIELAKHPTPAQKQYFEELLAREKKSHNQWLTEDLVRVTGESQNKGESDGTE